MGGSLGQVGRRRFWSSSKEPPMTIYVVCKSVLNVEAVLRLKFDDNLVKIW